MNGDVIRFVAKIRHPGKQEDSFWELVNPFRIITQVSFSISGFHVCLKRFRCKSSAYIYPCKALLSLLPELLYLSLAIKHNLGALAIEHLTFTKPFAFPVLSLHPYRYFFFTRTDILTSPFKFHPVSLQKQWYHPVSPYRPASCFIYF